MSTVSSTHFQELTWEQARPDVAKVNPTLTQIIDELSPSSKYTLFKAAYPFGSEILKNGAFYLPGENGSLVPFNSRDVNQHIQSSLDYNLGTNPVTLVLDKSLELFVTVEDRIIPYSLLLPGNIFGLWRILSDPTQDNLSHAPVSIWDMTAGARSIFMLPKISEQAAHDKLKRKYQFNIDKPKLLKDHWEIFKAIANSREFNQPWLTRLIFFSKQWFENLEDKKWKNLKLYLLNTAWAGSEFWRNQFTWGLTFSRIHSNRGIRPPAYIADIVKHLLAIGVSSVPGFAPAIDDMCAPIGGLQDAYEDAYNLKPYAPIIIQPSLFSIENPTRSIYYSMQYHTAIELSQKSSQRASVITDIYAIHSLLKKYLEDIKKSYLNISKTPLHELVQKVDYTFFHSSMELYKGINSSEKITIEDSTFTQACQNCLHKNVSKNSPFFNGCVRISSNKTSVI